MNPTRQPLARTGLVVLLSLASWWGAGERPALPEGELYESLDGRTALRVQSDSELDLRSEASAGLWLVARYSIEEDGLLRVVWGAPRTRQALYYRITKRGLVDEEGQVLLSRASLEEVRREEEEARLRDEAARQARQAAELAALEELQRELELRRQELAPLQDSLDGERARELETGLSQLADEYAARLVEFINSDPPIVGEPLSETQFRAVRMKSAEDMVIARAYIEEGGDYRRAIRIYSNALQVDPDNSELRDALDRARELQYMTRARLAAIQIGMTEEEVRAVLGPVNFRNVRSDAYQGVTAWFYPTADGGAAAVFFSDGRVYATEYEAVRGQ